MHAAPWLGAVLLAGALAGCIAPSGGDPDAAPAGVPRCLHPWPCGDGREWPTGLEGPFALASMEEVLIPSHDGIVLHGRVFRPAVPEGVRVPIVLLSSPYVGNADPRATPEAQLQALEPEGPFAALVEAGFAVAAVSVRGTGASEGCLETFGANERQDQFVVVEALAALPWSNGRVGMLGFSYPGTTQWEAAVTAPPHLVTVVPGASFPDLYQHITTPQGAKFPWAGPVHAALLDGAYGNGPAASGGPVESVQRQVERAPHRACPAAGQYGLRQVTSPFTDDRDAAYWDERRLTDHFARIEAAVFVVHGLRDGLLFNEDELWRMLPQAPKRMLVGPWWHEWPGTNSLQPELALREWPALLVAWYDFWLKGLGDAPPGLGVVDYQDRTGMWRSSGSWPPAASRQEVLYLANEDLSPAPGEGDRAFRDVPYAGENLWTEAVGPVPVVAPEGFQMPYSEADPLCPEARDAGVAVAYLSEPLEAAAVLAGNPFAHAVLESTAPEGLVTLVLYDVEPGFACQAGRASGARVLSFGAADLRFHQGNFVAEPFPVDAPTPIRIDLHNLAERVEAGHRLAVALFYGDAADRHGRSSAATITVAAGAMPGATHLVLPLVEGSLGGAAPTLAYPPRPFTQGAR